MNGFWNLEYKMYWKWNYMLLFLLLLMLLLGICSSYSVHNKNRVLQKLQIEESTKGPNNNQNMSTVSNYSYIGTISTNTALQNHRSHQSQSQQQTKPRRSHPPIKRFPGSFTLMRNVFNRTMEFLNSNYNNNNIVNGLVEEEPRPILIAPTQVGVLQQNTNNNDTSTMNTTTTMNNSSATTNDTANTSTTKTCDAFTQFSFHVNAISVTLSTISFLLSGLSIILFKIFDITGFFIPLLFADIPSIIVNILNLASVTPSTQFEMGATILSLIDIFNNLFSIIPGFFIGTLMELISIFISQISNGLQIFTSFPNLMHTILEPLGITRWIDKLYGCSTT